MAICFHLCTRNKKGPALTKNDSKLQQAIMQGPLFYSQRTGQERGSTVNRGMDESVVSNFQEIVHQNFHNPLVVELTGIFANFFCWL